MNITEAVQEAGCRIDNIAHLGSMLIGHTTIPDMIENVFTLSDNTIQGVFPDIPEKLLRALNDVGFEEEALEWLVRSGKDGWLVQFSRPDPRAASGQTDMWRVARTHWVYADTLEEAVHRGTQWAKSLVKQG